MEAATVVVFGATGDLARRKIYPALFRLFARLKLYPLLLSHRTWKKGVIR